MAIVLNRQAVVDKARSVWAAAHSLGAELVQYVDVEFRPDGGAICTLKGNDGRYMATALLEAAEVAALGETVVAADATAKPAPARIRDPMPPRPRPEPAHTSGVTPGHEAKRRQA